MQLFRCILFLLFFWSFTLSSQTTVRTMFYNLLNYNGGLESNNRTPFLKTILDDVQPDLFLVCELEDEIGSNYLFNNALLPHNTNFKKAPFTTSQSPATSLLQMAYYNSKKLVLEKTEVIPTGVRDINHYTFKLNTVNINITPIYLEVFVTHLKASRGLSNRQKRLESIENFIQILDRIPSDRHVLFAGDFNFYTSNEEGFQKLIDDVHPIQIIDPINRLCPEFPDNGIDYFDENNYNSTYFWNNSSFADVHSQSTRSSALTDGSGGGMDDRFDFIMMSKNFTTNSNLFYETNSYKTIGNNGNCHNRSVNDTRCSGSYSLVLRIALYEFSDHLPIVMNIKTPESTLSSESLQKPFTFKSTNIVSNSLSLTLQNKSTYKKLIIYNQLGQKVIVKSIKNLNSLEINTQFLSKGIYYIKVDNYLPSKFIKK